MSALPTLEEVRRNLVFTFYGIAHALDMQIYMGAGAALLKLPPDSTCATWPDGDDFDLSAIEWADDLNTIYQYAFYGELSATEFIGDDSEDGNLGRLKALIEMSYGDVFDGWLDEAKSLHADEENPARGLLEMVQLADARFKLDKGTSLTLTDIALLAGINVRSVRNALHADGTSMLAAFRDKDGELVVDASEARRWLHRDRAFKETVRVGHFGSTSMPKKLEADGIIPFIASRILNLYGVETTVKMEDGSEVSIGTPYWNAGQQAGWSEEKVRALLAGTTIAINPEDCPAIARMLLVDTGWFTEQVMRARFPNAMQEVQPTNNRRADIPVSPLNEPEGTLEVSLTDVGIRNGYFDIERRYADRFFPNDCFGSRGAERRGEDILLIHDALESPYKTDMRVKSAALVSPRKRFSAYFTAHGAKAGDVIRFKRIGERNYELIYLPN